VGSALDADHGLARRGQHYFGRDRKAGVDLQPLKSGGSKQSRVNLALFDLAQPRLDVAADRNDLDVWPKAPHLRSAAWGRGADNGALLQLLDRFGPDDPVAHVAPWTDGCDMD